MNQKRFCTQQSHEQLQVYHVCTYRWCNMTRWCCSECLNNEIHRHQMPNQNHIMNQAKLQARVQQDIENVKKQYSDSKQGSEIKNFLSQMVKQTYELEKFIIAFRQTLEKQLNIFISDDDNFKLQQLINKVEEQNFILLGDEDINNLININSHQFNYNVQFQLQDPLDEIYQQLNNLQQNLKQHQEYMNSKIDFKSMKYSIHKIYERDEEEDEGYIHTSIVSTNEQYLVYNVGNLIHIYDIKMKKFRKQLQSKDSISQFQFTGDSKCLFAGDYKGFIYGYIVQNAFKRFYKQKLHQESIQHLIIQKQYLVTASFDKKIIKTDFIKKQQMFKLKVHSQLISIDYDISKDIIISTSLDKSIKVWDCANQSILKDYANINIFQRHIQLVNNKQDIMFLISTDLWKLKIDMYNKKQIQSFYQNEDEILGFQQVNDNQNLLVISEQHFKILNNKGELILTIQHNLNLTYRIFTRYPQQLDNLNYIILQDEQITSITIKALELKDYKIYIIQKYPIISPDTLSPIYQLYKLRIGYQISYFEFVYKKKKKRY